MTRHVPRTDGENVGLPIFVLDVAAVEAHDGLETVVHVHLQRQSLGRDHEGDSLRAWRRRQASGVGVEWHLVDRINHGGHVEGGDGRSVSWRFDLLHVGNDGVKGCGRNIALKLDDHCDDCQLLTIILRGIQLMSAQAASKGTGKTYR